MNDEVIQAFEKLRAKSTAMGKIPCLAVAVRGKKLTRNQIKRYLLSLCIPCEDYFKKEQKHIINWLWKVSNGKMASR